MKALILEDNFPLAQSLKDILSSEGWDAELSHSWNKARPLMDKTQFDLLVLDLLLPDKKGFEVLQILSQKENYSSLKIALISGFVDESFVEKNMPLSFKDNYIFFKKPLEEQPFLNFIKEIKLSHFEKTKGSLFEFFFEKTSPENALEFYLPPGKTFDSHELLLCVFLAHLKSFTGDFKIKPLNEKECRIQFHKGHIAQVDLAHDGSFLGALLVEHGLSPPEDIKNLLENKENKKIGEKLVEKRLLSPYMLNFILKEQFKIRLAEIISHASFTLNITKKSLKDKAPDTVLSEIDLLEWTADNLNTERTNDFLKNFLLEIQHYPIQKLKQINQTLTFQKQFIEDYNLWFKNLKDDQKALDAINKSKNENYTLKLLYFGLLTKSINLQNTAKESADEKKIEQLLDSILEKDSDDLFSILNLPWGAKATEAQNSYKQLIQKVHYDLLPTNAKKELKDKSEKAFLKIKKSYDILKDEKKRQEYINAQKSETFVTVMNKYEKGLSYLKAGQYKLAGEIFVQIANHKHAPSPIQLYVLWAKLKSSNEDLNHQRAKAAQYNKTIDSCPINLRTSPLFWYVKGLFYSKTSQYEKAQKLLEKALTIEKDFTEAKKELILVTQKLRETKRKGKKNILKLFSKPSG